MNAMLELGRLKDTHEPGTADTEILESIARLQRVISRILISQVIMRNANRALRAGHSEVLFTMDFSDEHVVELAERVRAGADGFPAYAFRNNSNLIRSLRKEQAILVATLSEAARNTLVQPKRSYRCQMESPAAIPFLAVYLPFVM